MAIVCQVHLSVDGSQHEVVDLAQFESYEQFQDQLVKGGDYHISDWTNEYDEFFNSIGKVRRNLWTFIGILNKVVEESAVFWEDDYDAYMALYKYRGYVIVPYDTFHSAYIGTFCSMYRFVERMNTFAHMKGKTETVAKWWLDRAVTEIDNNYFWSKMI
jgi:hypothetical protein